MKNALKLYREWDERRWPKWAGWWGRKRANGRGHYVRWATFMWGGAMVNISVLSDSLFGGGFSFEKFLIMLPLYLAGGWVVGAAGWSLNEGRYQKDLAGEWKRQLRQ